MHGLTPSSRQGHRYPEIHPTGILAGFCFQRLFQCLEQRSLTLLLQPALQPVLLQHVLLQPLAFLDWCLLCLKVAPFLTPLLQQALVTSTHQEKFLQQAQQLQQQLRRELTATADSHSRQMQLLFRWCSALKAASAVPPTPTTGQPPKLVDPLAVSLELVPAVTLAAQHMQQLRLLSVLEPLDDPDTTSSSSAYLSAVAAAYMSVVPSAADAVLCLQDALLQLGDTAALEDFLQRSSCHETAYHSMTLLFDTPDLLLPLSLTQIIYFGRELVHSFLQQQQQQQQQECTAAAASQSNTCSSSSGSWSEAEGLLLSGVDVLQSAAATTAHAAALLQHSSRVFEQQWQQLGYPPLATVPKCCDMLAATAGTSSSNSSTNSNADMVDAVRNAVILYDARVIRDPSKKPYLPSREQMSALASMMLSAAAAALGLAGTAAAAAAAVAAAVPLVEACVAFIQNHLTPLFKSPAEPAASGQAGCGGHDGSSSSSGGSSRAKGAAAKQQQQQQAASTSSCAGAAVSDELLIGQLVHLVQQLVLLTPPASNTFIGNSAAANQKPGGCSSSSSSHTDSRNSSGGSGSSRACDNSDGLCLDMVFISTLNWCLLWVKNKLKQQLNVPTALDPLLLTAPGAPCVSRMHQPSHLRQIACVLQGMEAAVRVLASMFLVPGQHFVVKVLQREGGVVTSRQLQPRQALWAMSYDGAQQVGLDQYNTTWFLRLGDVLRRCTRVSAQLMAFLEAPGGWEVLTETVPGQQLLQAWLSLQATTGKDYTVEFLQDPMSAYSGALTGNGSKFSVHVGLVSCITRRLQTALGLQQMPSQQQREQQREQQQKQQSEQEQQTLQQREQQSEQEPAGPSAKQQQQPSHQQQLQAAQLPDPQLVAAVLMQAARYHLHFAEELQAVEEVIEGAARRGDGHPTSAIACRARAVAFFFSKDGIMGVRLHPSYVTFVRYCASLQGLLQALLNLQGALAASAGGLQSSSKPQELLEGGVQPPGQGAAAVSQAFSGEQGEGPALQQPDQQLVQQWAAVFEAWVLPGAMSLQELLQSQAHSLLLTGEDVTKRMEEWSMHYAAVSMNPAAVGQQTRMHKMQQEPLPLPELVENAVQGMRALQEALLRMGQLLSVIIPSRYCCNNPGCGNMAGPSESFHLVRGKSCVCGGCVSQQQHDAGTGHALAAR